jgi:hypothetical protein
VQPSDAIRLGVNGIYASVISLTAGLNANDKNGRTYVRSLEATSPPDPGDAATKAVI